MRSSSLSSLIPFCLGLALAQGTAAARAAAAFEGPPILVAAASARADGPSVTNKKAAASQHKRKAARGSHRGKASWYGAKFKDRKTASGDRFSPRKMTAAHPSLPLGSKVRVTNLDNDKSAVLTVNDRLPQRSGRTIDVTKAAAEKLDFVEDGVTDVRIDVLSRPAE